MFELFKSKAEAVGAEVLRVGGPAAAIEAVMDVLVRERVEDVPGARAVWCEGSLLRGNLDQGALTRRVSGLTFEVTRDTAAASRVGVSEFDWGFAATGTLAQDATDPRLRLASTLPEVHVALLRTSGIGADVGALFTTVDPARMKYVACVTGPSRTADIERVLTIGVHGPRKVIVIAVDGAPEAS